MTIGKTTEYRTWNSMRQRCNFPHSAEYHNYGGRGISICERWQSFENFLADMGYKPSLEYSLDRIDNNGPYSPENCRWATKSQQARNSRQNRILHHDGQSLCVVEWAEKTGLTVGIIMSRIKLGWSIGETLTTPAKWKLKPEQVAQIKARLSGRNGAQLAREFGVSRGTISHIRSGRIWK